MILYRAGEDLQAVEPLRVMELLSRRASANESLHPGLVRRARRGMPWWSMAGCGAHPWASRWPLALTGEWRVPCARSRIIAERAACLHPHSLLQAAAMDDALKSRTKDGDIAAGAPDSTSGSSLLGRWARLGQVGWRCVSALRRMMQHRLCPQPGQLCHLC